jgi:hypothetical protein
MPHIRKFLVVFLLTSFLACKKDAPLPEDWENTTTSSVNLGDTIEIGNSINMIFQNINDTVAPPPPEVKVIKPTYWMLTKTETRISNFMSLCTTE